MIRKWALISIYHNLLDQFRINYCQARLQFIIERSINLSEILEPLQLTPLLTFPVFFPFISKKWQCKWSIYSKFFPVADFLIVVTFEKILMLFCIKLF